LSADDSPNAGSGRTSCIVRTCRSLSLLRFGSFRPNACASDPFLHDSTRTAALGIFAGVCGLTNPFAAPVGRVARATASRDGGEKAVSSGC
jgi:hypothetical protein